MGYIRALFMCLLTIPFLFNVPTAEAAPPEDELNQYLSSIGWTRQDLQDYLDYYEIPLDEFSTVEELKDVMGTPINSTNYQELLTRYGLTDKQLRDLLDHFGDNLSDYKFIEDLDASVEYYVHYDEYMADIEQSLGEFGITEEESERLFTYLTQVEEKNKNQLDQIFTNDTLWEQLANVQDTTQLTDEQMNELVRILEESLGLYEIQLKLQVKGKPVTFKELLQMETLPGDLSGSVYTTSGELLLDFNIPKEYFESFEGIEDGEDLLHLGEISDDYVDHMHDEKNKAGENRLK